jgi:hypothetical protein
MDKLLKMEHFLKKKSVQSKIKITMGFGCILGIVRKPQINGI